ncbi:hypothetical protein BSL78_11063 [Apostichopus japonicus]|uniref:Uncharacterized protein n=1 Tax=Stichopus japonicus TaxID=307972 RepID=A0A2G8KVW3_STIJA|nr:hypothetical protein BSL78_11063 [Apostichopus japonicus]
MPDLDPIVDGTQAAEGFDDSEDGEGWERVVKNKGKKGRNGTVLPKPTQSLQRELINATGQEDWFGDNSSVSKGNITKPQRVPFSVQKLPIQKKCQTLKRIIDHKMAVSPVFTKPLTFLLITVDTVIVEVVILFWFPSLAGEFHTTLGIHRRGTHINMQSSTGPVTEKWNKQSQQSPISPPVTNQPTSTYGSRPRADS